MSSINDAHKVRAQSILESLRSDFTTMPKGQNFLERSDFADAYATLARETRWGENISEATLLSAITINPRAWVVIRSMIGLTPPEMGHLVKEMAKKNGEVIDADQGLMRRIEANAKHGKSPLVEGRKATRADRLVRASLPYLAEILRTPPNTDSVTVHRFDKVDTAQGQESIIGAFKDGISYSDLLYERVLGRPFASHKDSVSGQVGNLIEDALEELFEAHGIDFVRTRTREVIPEFEQAPDFRIPADNPEIIIEAKLGEDDGTARDKVARVRTLRSNEDAKPEEDRCQVIAVIEGRGFTERETDLKRLLESTDGYTYTLAEIDQLIAPGGPLERFIDASRD